MTNFESVRKFMETFGQEIKEKAEFPNKKITSSAAFIMCLLNFESRSLFFVLTIAAAFFMIAIDWMTKGLTKKSPMLKCLLDLSVDAPQYLSPGTLILPILSNSILYFIFDSLL